MTIADTIKSLKPGDRVRVTFEDEVTRNHTDKNGVVHLSIAAPLDDTDPTITSIEVIERPLQVGDRVSSKWYQDAGAITALDDTHAIVDTGAVKVAVLLSDLRRAS